MPTKRMICHLAMSGIASHTAGAGRPVGTLAAIAKWQIILFVGVMEAWRENKLVLSNEGQKHYMSGGKPGYFPTFDMVPHPVPFNLYDPWNVFTTRTEEAKARGRLVEINNGRLAMIGLMGFVAEASAP